MHNQKNLCILNLFFFGRVNHPNEPNGIRISVLYNCRHVPSVKTVFPNPNPAAIKLITISKEIGFRIYGILSISLNSPFHIDPFRYEMDCILGTRLSLKFLAINSTNTLSVG